MNKTFLSAVIGGFLFASSLVPAYAAEQQVTHNDDVIELKNIVSAQQQSITTLQSSNQQLRTQSEQQYKEYQSTNQKLQQQIEQLTQAQESTGSQLSNVSESVTALDSSTQEAQQRLTADINKLGAQTETQAANLEATVKQNSLLGLLGLLSLLALLGAVFWYLRRQYQQQNKQDDNLLSEVQSALASVKQAEENIVQADTQLATQLGQVLTQIQQEQGKLNEMAASSSNASSIGEEEVDHSLATKLADEMHRMRRRINALPEGTKGLKALSKSLERLEEELEEKGYEIIDYTGMDYLEGMTLKARFIPSDDLDDGQSVITRVVYPQVNFNGKLIQQADVEVSVG